jgi:hypothetical protein
MKSSFIKKFFLLMLVASVMLPFKGLAWTEHPLLVSKALKDLPVWKKMDSIQAKSLKTFLIENEKELVAFLAEEEKWALTNLPNYAKCTGTLAFKATGNQEDILNRFFQSIRINPGAKIPLYLYFLPDVSAGNKPLAQPSELTTLKDISSMLKNTYVRIQEGEKVFPFDVLCTASEEPDYGFDLGLFEDNNTSYGKLYGFGVQPFGNPNLEYSSQAPFHMGFYHEAKILYKFGAFLKQTHLDYRIFLYKALSEFAFRQNQPYWGWRFMGWGMHYMGDVSMPYHMKPLPGVSTLRMIWINLKSMLGMPKAQKYAVQLVSNRHSVLEEFQVQAMKKAVQENNLSYPLFQALSNPLPSSSFSYNFLIDLASKESADNAKSIDKALKKNVPGLLVSDPSVEANDRPEIKNIMQYMIENKGPEAVNNMTGVVAIQMRQLSRNVRSYMESVLINENKK